jgi:hypothetical protein
VLYTVEVVQPSGRVPDEPEPEPEPPVGLADWLGIGQTVVPTATVLVVTWGRAGQLVTVGAQEVTVSTMVL